MTARLTNPKAWISEPYRLTNMTPSFQSSCCDTDTNSVR